MFAKAIDGWQPRTRGELGDAFPLLEEHAVYKHDGGLHIARSTMLANTPAAERMSARSKSCRWRNSVAVFCYEIPGSSYIATVESPEPRYARSALSEFKFNQASLARS